MRSTARPVTGKVRPHLMAVRLTTRQMGPGDAIDILDQHMTRGGLDVRRVRLDPVKVAAQVKYMP